MKELLRRICAEPTCREAPIALYRAFRTEGVLDDVAQISEATVEEYLRENPELVDQWVGLSEDQRCTPAWYVERSTWVVGYVSKTQSILRRSFPDGFKAVAYFIKRHSEELVRSAETEEP